MEEKKKDYIKIGKRYRIRDHFTYEHGYVPEWDLTNSGQGSICFKDEEIFLNEPDEVCYICECAFLNGYENDAPSWCTISTGAFTEQPLGWTANQIREECRKFLLSHPRFRLDVDEFAHYYFTVMTWEFDKTEVIDPWTSAVSLLEAATNLQKIKDEEIALLTQNAPKK